VTYYSPATHNLTWALYYAVRDKTTAESRYVQNLIVFEMKPEAKLLRSQTARRSGPYVELASDGVEAPCLYRFVHQNCSPRRSQLKFVRLFDLCSVCLFNP